VISTAAGPSVAAAGADGIKIAKVRYITKTVRAKKRFRMIVTVRDRQNRLVRGATVRTRLAASPGKRFVRGKQQRMKRSGKLGQVNFLMLVRKPALGKRVAMVTTAQTPTAKAQKKTSVRLPKAKTKKRARH
jgi:hypothetical protein